MTLSFLICVTAHPQPLFIFLPPACVSVLVQMLVIFPLLICCCFLLRAENKGEKREEKKVTSEKIPDIITVLHAYMAPLTLFFHLSFLLY